MTNLTDKFAGLQTLIDQVEQLQAATNTTLAAILAALGGQPNLLPTLEQIAGTLQELLTSVRRIEQFIAPVEQTPPAGVEAGMAYDLARLARVAAGPPGTPAAPYYLQDLCEPLIDAATPAVVNTNVSVARLRDAIWPYGDVRPGTAEDEHRSLYWLVYRLLYWTTLEYPAQSDAKNTITSLYSIDDRLSGLYMLSNLIRQNLGDKVNNLTAIDFLSQIADCSCSGEVVPPGQSCSNPVISSGVREYESRNYAMWSSNHQAFFTGAITIVPDTAWPEGATLSSAGWSGFMVFVSSRNAAYWKSAGDEVGALFPTNKWMQVPFSDGAQITFTVPVGGEISVYLCGGEITQPPPVETGWTRLYSADAVIYEPNGDWYEAVQAIVGYSALGLVARDLNTSNDWRLVAPGGAIVDLADVYQFVVSRSCNQFDVFGVGRVIDAGTLYTAGPQTNFALGTGDTIPNVAFYVDIRLEPGPV